MALNLRVLGLFLDLEPSPNECSRLGGRLAFNSADFDRWPVAALILIFSNLGKADFWPSARGRLDAKEALYLQIRNRVA